jgi:O-glycosyl hydrolase
MTEHSQSDPEDWNKGAMVVAQRIHDAMVYGNCSAWVWWQLSKTDNYKDEPLMPYEKAGNRYDVSKHFYRYIRPGAVRMDCTSDNADVLASAFAHPKDKTLTIELINPTERPISVKLSGRIDKTCQVFRSTISEKCVSAGMVNVANGSVELPPNSLVTIFGKI